MKFLLWLSVLIDLRVVQKGKVKISKPKYFGVWPLRLSRKFKLNRLPADCDILLYNGSQLIAKFNAGRISLPASTGRDNNNNTAVITTAHPNKANFIFINKIPIFKPQIDYHIFFFISTVVAKRTPVLIPPDSPTKLGSRGG